MEDLRERIVGFSPIFITIILDLLDSNLASLSRKLEIVKKTRIGKRAFLNGLLAMPIIYLDDFKKGIVGTRLITKNELDMLINQCFEQ
jgi:hypothetical protein